MGRRVPPQPLQPGPLTRQTADAWNGWAQEVNVLLGGFHADPPLNVTQDAGGVSYRIDAITGADPDTNETITGDWLVQGASGDPASLTFGSFSQLVIPTTFISAPTVGSIAWVNNTQYVWNGSVWVLVGGGVVTHVTWGTDQTDYTLPDNTRVLVVDLSANVVLRSIVGGYDARHLWIVNKNNSFTLTLGNEDGAGAATARMRLPGAANLALDAIYEGVGLAYSGTDSRWYCLDEAAGSGAASTDVVDTPGGRLTISSEPTEGALGVGSVNYVAYLHNRVPLWDGSNWVTKILPSSPITLNISGFFSGVLYDVFIKISGSTVALDKLAWKSVTASNNPSAGSNVVINLSDTTGLAVGMYVMVRDGVSQERTMIAAVSFGTSITVNTLANSYTTPAVYGYPARATALTRLNGRLVRSGTPEWLYLGTVYPFAGSFTDSPEKRHIWNYYNRIRRILYLASTTDSYTYSANAYANTTAKRLEVVTGLWNEAIVDLVFVTFGSASSTAEGSVAIGDNSITTPASLCVGMKQTFGANITPVHAHLRDSPFVVGLHYYSWLERGDGSATFTWYGDNGDSDKTRAALVGFVEG